MGWWTRRKGERAGSGPERPSTPEPSGLTAAPDSRAIPSGAPKEDADLDSMPSPAPLSTPIPAPSVEHNAGACTRRLRCLSRVAECIHQYDHIDALLRDVAAVLPFGWEYAEKANAEIVWDGRSYHSDGFERGPWTLRSDILLDGRARGTVEVSYLEPCPSRGEDPFLSEERTLIKAIAHLLGVGIERRRAKQSLSEAEEKFLGLFHNAHSGVLLIEQHTKRCCLANPMFCRMSGYSPDDIPDLQLSDLQPPPEHDSEIDPQCSPLIGQHAMLQDLPFRRKDGTLFFVDMSSFPIMVGDREYWLDLFKDVTERKNTASLHDEALEQLQTSNRELNDFMFLVSHDLKALRRGMDLIGLWACGQGTDLSEAEARVQIPHLTERIQRLDDMVTLVVRYSKIGQIDETPAPVDLHRLVQDLVEALAVPERITLQIEPTLPVVQTRHTAIREAFCCLLSNALRQVGEAEGLIRISCTEDDGRWRFGVHDSGPGIAAPYHQGLFRLFQATPNGHWEDFGVALAMAKRSVEACGGRIGLESTMGQGSTFFFTLPKTRIEEPCLVGRSGQPVERQTARSGPHPAREAGSA